QVPARLPRLVRVAAADGSTYVWLEDVLRAGLAALFPGQRILDAGTCRIARDAELDLDDEGGTDYVANIEEELRKRRRSRALRLEMDAAAGDALVSTLSELLGVEPRDIYRIAGPQDIRALAPLVDSPGLADLRDRALRPLSLPDLQEDEDLFAT